MKIHYIFIYTLLLISKSSCKTEEKTTNQLEVFPQLQDAKNKSLIYVIPGAGCPGCISEAEKFAVEKHNNDSFYFVFTRISSSKLFRLKFPELSKANNVIIDTQNIYESPEEKFTKYPAIYLKEQDKFILQQYIKPD